MPRISRAARRQIYHTVLSTIRSAPEFEFQDIRESLGVPYHDTAQRIVDQLVSQGSLLLVDTTQGRRYRWAADPAEFPDGSWIDSQFLGTQLTSTPQHERPRERLLKLGASLLRTAELLAILIRSGRPGESALQSGEMIVNRLGERFDTLPGLGLPELRDISRAVSEPAYCQIMAGIELGRRISKAIDDGLQHKVRITSPASAMQFCLSRFSRLAKEAKQEEFHMVTLDTKNQPIGSHQITVGTLRNSLVHPREVFRPAIRDAANCILVLHNHPSGDPTPSDQDFRVTERLESAAEIIGIPVIDHIVVAGNRAVSIQEWRSGNR
jgi:DNA repair protein RadC